MVRSAARSILGRWDRELGALVAAKPDAELRVQLTQRRWLPEGIEQELVGGRLQAGAAGTFPMSPSSCGGNMPGMVSGLTSCRGIEHDGEPTTWMIALGIRGVGDFDDPGKVLGALHALRGAMPSPDPEQTAVLEQTYRALIDSLTPDVPRTCATFPFWSDGRVRALAGAGPANPSGTTPGNTATRLLPFQMPRSGLSVGVAREWRTRSTSWTSSLPVHRWRLVAPRILCDGWRWKRHCARRCRIFAAAVTSPQPRFPTHEALDRTATLRVRHAQKAWLEYSFAGRVGTWGKEEVVDAFLVPEGPGGAAYILFDGPGPDLPLDACGRLLSELLCDNRAFAPLFSAVLSAWASSNQTEEIPQAVRRFRRDNGVSEGDVRDWRERLEAKRLDPQRIEMWRKRVTRALASSGWWNRPPLSRGARSVLRRGNVTA